MLIIILEHPEIGWIERTGYPSWLQPGKCSFVEDEGFEEDEEPEDLDDDIVYED